MAMKIVCQILSPLSLTKHEDGRLIFDLWKKHLPRLLPDKYGNWEPIDRPFDQANIEAALDAWKWPFLTIRSTPSVAADVWMRKGTQQLHASWLMSLDADAASQTELVGFIRAAAVALRADFGCVHLLTPAEVERGRIRKMVLALNKESTKFTFLIGSKELQQRIPDLFWATVFGAPYVKMLGEDRLLSAPAYAVQSLSNEAVLLQMTEKLSDVEEHLVVFNETRSRVETHLGNDAFFQEHGVAGDYRVPQFDFT